MKFFTMRFFSRSKVFSVIITVINVISDMVFIFTVLRKDDIAIQGIALLGCVLFTVVNIGFRLIVKDAQEDLKAIMDYASKTDEKLEEMKIK